MAAKYGPERSVWSLYNLPVDCDSTALCKVFESSALKREFRYVCKTSQGFDVFFVKEGTKYAASFFVQFDM